MAVHETAQLYTHITESADYSSSSCPPSANSDESAVPEGYLIFTFDKSKKARVKTAVFADASDCQYGDEYDDEDVEDVEEVRMNWPDPNGQHNPSDKSPHQCSKENQLDSSLENCNPQFIGGHYGEAVWVGDGDDVTTHSDLPTTTTTTSLIQTSPITKPLTCDQHASSNLKLVDPRHIHPSGLQNPLRLANSQSSLLIVPNHSPKSNKRPFSLSNKLHFPSAGSRSMNTTSSWRATRSDRSFAFRTHGDDGLENGRYGRKMLRCEACGKYYRNEYSLDHHICLKRKDVWKKGDVPSEVIDGQLIYFCPACHKPFKWLGNLTRHFYVHTGQRFFKCDMCSKEFFSAYQVKRHMNSHTGRRFKCGVCEKPFTCKYACAWHERQHYISALPSG